MTVKSPMGYPIVTLVETHRVAKWDAMIVGERTYDCLIGGNENGWLNESRSGNRLYWEEVGVPVFDYLS